MCCVHRHRIARSILNHPSGKVDDHLSDVGDLDPFTTRPRGIVSGPVRIRHDLSDSHVTLHIGRADATTAVCRSRCIGIRIDIIVGGCGPWNLADVTARLGGRHRVDGGACPIDEVQCLACVIEFERALSVLCDDGIFPRRQYVGRCEIGEIHPGVCIDRMRP